MSGNKKRLYSNLNNEKDNNNNLQPQINELKDVVEHVDDGLVSSDTVTNLKVITNTAYDLLVQTNRLDLTALYFTYDAN